MKKGQITVEFLIAIIFLVFIFSFSLFVFGEKNSGFTYSTESFTAKLLAEELAGKINAAFLAGNGAEVSLLLEKKGDFNVLVSNGSVKVEFRSGYASAKILTKNTPYSKIRLGTKINIKNQNGVIVIEST